MNEDINEENVKSIEYPKPVGAYWLFDDIGFFITKKPSWIHRKIVHLVLGWRWKDGAPAESDND